MRMVRIYGLAALIGLGMACGGSSDDGGGPSLSIARNDGENQTGDISTALDDSIVVLVTENGAVLAGTTVTWSAQGAGASVSPATSVTDANGLAATAWTLGSEPGPQTARATVSGAGGSPLTFHASAIGGTGVAFGTNFFRSNRNGTQDPAVDTTNVGLAFTWNGVGGSHTVRSQGTPSFDDSGTLNGDDTYTVTFTTPGTYQYDCEIHGAQMTGRVVVFGPP
jgi:plastocyanin